MKYMPLDLSMMKPEPFPYPLNMRSDLHPRKRLSDGEGWSGQLPSFPVALRSLIHQCGERIRAGKMVKTLLSVAGACAFGLLAVGVFWLAVEMDNSELQAAKSSCSARR